MFKKRDEKRFDIKFIIASNNIEGKGIEISLKGLAFLTEEEIVPASEIPFEMEIKSPLLKDTVYKISGIADLLYSRKINDKEFSYRNGLYFKSLSDGSGVILDKIVGETGIKERK